MSSERPNVLFVMDDQHNARCLGCYGNETVETPTVDRLASEGTRFDSAYCQNPICLPSRTCFLTGRYAHSTGVYGNYGELDADVLSLPHHLRGQGYETSAFGKLHIPTDWPTHGFETRRTCDFADAEHHTDENHYYSYLERVGYADEYDLGLASSEYPHTAFISNIPYEHCVEKWTADETLRWLRTRDDDRPFFAWMTFQRPHPPYAPPPEYADRYDPEDVELPLQSDGEFASKPEPWRDRKESDLFRRSDETDIRQVVAYYYALITLIDEQVGRVVDHLRETGELDNTVVVFCSDHGDFAGEHGLVRKNVGISEAVHRVPFVWRWPEGVEQGAVEDGLVETVDFFPTVCDLLDVPTPDPVQGRSLAETLSGEGAVDREAVFCERGHLKTVRTERWKLTHYVGSDEGELYDMAADPWEHHNLFEDPDYRDVKVDLLERLLDFYAETEEATIPEGASALHGTTEAHTAWTKRWWEEGGSPNPTPLAHLDGPGYPVEDDPGG